MPRRNDFAEIAPPLHLPPARLRLRHAPEGGAEVFDPYRQRWLVLTPEEWVRQHFVDFLVNVKGVPAGLVANERPITLNSTRKRCDTVIYSRSLAPLAIVEYKAPSVPISPAVFNQIARYNIVLRVPYLIVSNGLTHYCCRVDYDNDRCEFLTAIPTYAEMAGE